MNEERKIDREKLLRIKQERKEFYNNLRSIFCPYLKKKVNFNEEGFGHLLSKSWNRGRSDIDQYTRLRIFPKVVDIIKLSHTLQEYDERLLMVRQKINSRWEKRSRITKYYVFIHLLKDDGLRLKVIVKEIRGGEPFFWSVYPSWRIDKIQNGNSKKVFYSGNLEED